MHARLSFVVCRLSSIHASPLSTEHRGDRWNGLPLMAVCGVISKQVTINDVCLVGWRRLIDRLAFILIHFLNSTANSIHLLLILHHHPSSLVFSLHHLLFLPHPPTPLTMPPLSDAERQKLLLQQEIAKLSGAHTYLPHPSSLPTDSSSFRRDLSRSNHQHPPDLLPPIPRQISSKGRIYLSRTRSWSWWCVVWNR